MWTKKGAMILSGAVLLIIFGAIFRNLTLLAISIVFLSYTFISVISNRVSQLYPNRQTSNEKIFEDGSVKIELRLLNQGGKTGFLEVRDKLPVEMDMIRGSNYTFLNLNPNQEAKIPHRISPPKRFPIDDAQSIISISHIGSITENINTICKIPVLCVIYRLTVYRDIIVKHCLV